MATFSGTIEEFDKFIGPRLRNLVQTSIARKHRVKVGKCEVCGCKKDLESAHVHGRERRVLLRQACADYMVDGNVLNVDLELVEQKFRELHLPVKDTFKILCKSCHKDYDNVKEEIEINEEVIDDGNSVSQQLKISLYPQDVLEFKELLLMNKSALIKTYYNDGSVDTKIWKATRFTEDSDVLGNLRSRAEFRQGVWQKAGIKEVEVSVRDL